MCFAQSQYKGNHKGGRPKAAPLCGGGRRPPPLYWLWAKHMSWLSTQHMSCVSTGQMSWLSTRQNLSSEHKTHSLLWTVSLDFGQVLFLGKIKACLACNKPNIKDKIPSKVTSDVLKWKSDCSWKSGWCIVKMHIKWWFWWKSHIKRIHLRSFS